MSLDDVDLQCLFLDAVDRARRGNKPKVVSEGLDMDFEIDLEGIEDE